MHLSAHMAEALDMTYYKVNLAIIINLLIYHAKGNYRPVQFTCSVK